MEYNIAKSILHLILKGKRNLSNLHPVRIMAHPKDGKKKPYMTTVWKTDEEIKEMKKNGVIDKKTEPITHPTTGKNVKAFLHKESAKTNVSNNDKVKDNKKAKEKKQAIKTYKRITKPIQAIIQAYLNENTDFSLKNLISHLKAQGIQFEDSKYLKGIVDKMSSAVPKPVKELEDKIKSIKDNKEEETVVDRENDSIPSNKEGAIIITESYCDSLKNKYGISSRKALTTAIGEAITKNPNHKGIYFKPKRGKTILQEEPAETVPEPRMDKEEIEIIPSDSKISPFAMDYLTEEERKKFTPELLQADANRYKKNDFNFQMDSKRHVELKGYQEIYGKEFPNNFSYDSLKINGKNISIDWLLNTDRDNIKNLHNQISNHRDSFVGFTPEIKNKFAKILSEVMQAREKKNDKEVKPSSKLEEATSKLQEKVNETKPKPLSNTNQKFRLDSDFNNKSENFTHTLYTRDSNNKLRFWQIECNSGKYRTKAGMIGWDADKYEWSKWTVAKGKNSGKKNATTPEEQARLEANSKVRSQLNEGRYFESIEDAKKQNPIIFPMLAEKYEEKKKYVQEYLKKGGKLFVQPKLDGIRCVVSTEGRIHSRNNEDIKTQPQLSPLLSIAKKHNVVFDGELYNHDYATEFGTVQSLVRNESQQEELRKQGHKLEYHIYDAYFKDSPDMDFKERYNKLKSIPELQPMLKSNDIKFVDTKEVDSEEKANDLLSSHLDSEYEGSIVRMNTPYEVDKRTTNLLKRKMFDDDEFTIHDIEEGKGNSSGMAGRVIFKNKHTGGTFASGFEKSIKANAEFKKELLKNKHKYIGKIATVNYMGLHDGKVPRHPRVKAIHEGARM